MNGWMDGCCIFFLHHIKRYLNYCYFSLLLLLLICLKKTGKQAAPAANRRSRPTNIQNVSMGALLSPSNCSLLKTSMAKPEEKTMGNLVYRNNYGLLPDHQILESAMLLIPIFLLNFPQLNEINTNLI